MPDKKKKEASKFIYNCVRRGLAGMVLLVVFASSTGDRWKIASVTVYGACLFLMFLFSTSVCGRLDRAETREAAQIIEKLNRKLAGAGCPPHKYVKSYKPNTQKNE